MSIKIEWQRTTDGIPAIDESDPVGEDCWIVVKEDADSDPFVTGPYALQREDIEVLRGNLNAPFVWGQYDSRGNVFDYYTQEQVTHYAPYEIPDLPEE